MGLIPGGSKDPFAVRRQGNGTVKIILDHRFPLSFERLIRWSLEAYGSASIEALNELQDFFKERLKFFLEEKQFSFDCINAAIAVGFDDPVDTLDRVQA